MNQAASAESVVIVGRITRQRGKRVELLEGSPAARRTTRPLRVARTLALAHVFRELIDAGVVRDQVELAALTGFTRARITQMLDLTLLAPEIQETILFTEEPAGGRGIAERELRAVGGQTDWRRQRLLWARRRPPSSAYQATGG